MFQAIRESGLYNKVTQIRCGILGQNIGDDLKHPLFKDPKVKILYHSTDTLAFERPTLRLLYDHSNMNMDEDFLVLYIHSKGVRWNGQNKCVTDWVEYLTYFNIIKHENCLNKLIINDVVGVNLQHDPCTHFSGNFWWSHSNYIKTLNPHIDKTYNGPEFWICQPKENGETGSFCSLFEAGVNHYEERFTSDKYIV
jgi:hypothetical protein